MRTLLFLLLAMIVGCWSSGPKVRLEGAVGVFDAPPEIDADAFKAKLRARISELEGVGSGGAPVQLLADFDQRIRLVDDQPVREWVLRVGFKPLAGATDAHRVSALAKSPTLQALTSSATKAFAARWAMRRASDREVLGRLEKGAGPVRAAIEEAGQRRLRAAVSPLSERLARAGTSDEVALLIIEALTAIGDPAAAPALIQATNRESPLIWPPALFGLSKLGGRQAEGFLFTVAQGHPNPDVQRRARLALDEMARTDDSSSE